MDRRRVLFAVNSFAFGGAQKLYVDLFNAFDHSKFEIHLLTLFQFPERQDMYGLLNPAVKVHRLNFRGFTDLRSWLQLLSLLRRLRPHTVVSSLFFCNTTLRVLKLLVGYRIYACEHNTYVGKSKFQQAVDRALSHVSQGIVAVSSSVAKFTSAQERIPMEKFTVIRNGISIKPIDSYVATHDREATRARLGFAPGQRIALSVGRLTPQKNQRLLLDSFAAFAPGHPSYRLVILGEGTLRAELEAQVDSLALGDRVQLLGARHDIFDFYLAADFLVSTSTIEGLSIAYGEALAFGLPLLATRTAGTDEMVVDGVNGFFIQSQDVAAAVEGLQRIDRSDLRQLASGAKRSAEGFAIEPCAAAYASLIER